MYIAVHYEDDSIWIKMTPEEFKELISQKLGDKGTRAIDEIIIELKNKTLNA